MPNLTRADLVTRIGDLTGDPQHTRWTSTKKVQKIDEWQERFVADTRALVDVQTTTLVAATSEYDLPTDIIDVLRVSHNGRELERTSAYDLDRRAGAGWTSTAGTPDLYYVDLDPDNKKIRLYPIPGSGDVAYSLILEYVKIPPALSGDTSVPFNGHTLMTPYHMAIAYAAASDLLKIELRRDPNAQSLALQISAYEKEYSKMKAECIDLFRGMGRAEPIRFAQGRYF